MQFLTSLPHRHFPIDRLPTPGLTGAAHALAGSDAVRNVALDIALHLHMAPGASGRAHVRALEAGGLEVVVVSTGTLKLERASFNPDVRVLTDHWHDDKGDCMLVRVLDGPKAVDLPFGVMEHALGGAQFSGDAWAMSAGAAGITLLVIDGLGHGPLAENAALAGVEALRGMTPLSPAEDLRRVHDALRGTVGAAGAVARLDPAHKFVDYGGIGNIDAALITDDRRAGLVSYPGVVGHGMPDFRTYRHVIGGKTHLVMHTDGVRASWGPARYPGLFLRHPALISAVLFRDCWRQSDDALIFVVEVSREAQTTLATMSVEVGRGSFRVGEPGVISSSLGD